MALTPFEQAIALTDDPAAPDTWQAVIPPEWTQGRTAFGGLTAALQLAAVRAMSGSVELPVRTVDVSFVGPVRPGPVRVGAQQLRAGRNYTTAVAQLIQDDAVCSQVSVVSGQPRVTQGNVAAQPPEPTPRDDGVPMPHVPGLTPEFAQNFDLRFAAGVPYSGAADPVMTGWCRHRTPAPGAVGLVALMDAWPPTILPVLAQPAPISTLRWHVTIPGEVGDGADWHWYQARTVMAQGGLALLTAELWAADTLVAWSEQTVAVFDPR